jgi:hypothetical protein
MVIHKVETAVIIKKLHFTFFRVSAFDLLPGFESPVQYRLIDQISDFGSGKGIPLARFDKLKIHDSVGFTLQFEI